MILAVTIAGQGGGSRVLKTALEAAGCEVTTLPDGDPALLAGPVCLVMGNANWYPELCRHLERTARSERPFVVIWHFEPLPPPRAAGLPRPRLHAREVVKIALRDARATDPYTNLRRLQRLHRDGLPDLLVVSTADKREFLAEQGVESHWIPLGYGPSSGRDLGLTRDIDVLFLGGLDVPRRERAIRSLRARGIDVVEKGGWSGGGYWGENRTRLLNRTKILLNLARQPGHLSGMRLILGMANKALVVSEPIWNPAPYVEGEHFVSAPLEELPDLIRHHLEHEDERRRIAEQGHRFVTAELTMERSVSHLLGLIREGLARPVPAGGELG